LDSCRSALFPKTLEGIPMAHRRHREQASVAGKAAAGAREVLRLHVTLLDTDPPVWRDVNVDSGIPLDRFHDVLQRLMGWTDSHLHQFIVGRKPVYYGVPDPEGLGPKTLDEQSVRIQEVLPRKGSTILYEYDFGDSWIHEIRVDEVSPRPGEFPGPSCEGGARACPPEDCGGAGGYAEFLDALRDPKHERHTELLEWIGGEFDPEAFDPGRTNRALRRLR